MATLLCLSKMKLKILQRFCIYWKNNCVYKYVHFYELIAHQHENIEGIVIKDFLNTIDVKKGKAILKIE